MKCVEVYKELYHQEPFDVAFCPYRISPLGAHIDHQYGKINGLAIDKGIHMAYHPKQNGVVELQSLNFPKRAQFFVSAVPDEKQGDWADHLRGAAKMLGEKYRLKVGLSGIIEGSLPIGGLSSSASVIICFLSALCKVNGIHLEPMEMILTAKAAENQYVGVSCGKLDQSCEVLSKKNHLLYLDTKDDSYELIPTSEKMKPYKVAIFFSGLERSLKNSKYNLRQDECKAAAYALMGYAGMDYDSHKVLMGGVDFPLKGKVRCGNCRRVMAHNFKQAVPTFWCREGLELVGQTQCTSEVFQVSDIENAVFQALKKELSLLDVLYGDIQKEEQGLKEAHKKASRRKTLMEQELKNLKGEKMRMYEEYAAGTLLLDTYKQKKQECDRRISEVQEQIEQSKVEESTKSVVPGTVRAAAEQAENFLNGTRLTASMVSAFIENVFVYDGGRIVVRFKYEQSIQDAVKALHTG